MTPPKATTTKPITLWKRTAMASGSKRDRRAGRAAAGWRTAVVSVIGLVLGSVRRRLGGRHDLVLAHAGGELGNRAAASHHDDAIAEAKQLGHFARRDEDAQSPCRKIADTGVDFAL